MILEATHAYCILLNGLSVGVPTRDMERNMLQSWWTQQKSLAGSPGRSSPGPRCCRFRYPHWEVGAADLSPLPSIGQWASPRTVLLMSRSLSVISLKYRSSRGFRMYAASFSTTQHTAEKSQGLGAELSNNSYFLATTFFVKRHLFRSCEKLLSLVYSPAIPESWKRENALCEEGTTAVRGYKTPLFLCMAGIDIKTAGAVFAIFVKTVKLRKLHPQTVWPHNQPQRTAE